MFLLVKPSRIIYSKYGDMYIIMDPVGRMYKIELGLAPHLRKMEKISTFQLREDPDSELLYFFPDVNSAIFVNINYWSNSLTYLDFTKNGEEMGFRMNIFMRWRNLTFQKYKEKVPWLNCFHIKLLPKLKFIILTLGGDLSLYQINVEEKKAELKKYFNILIDLASKNIEKKLQFDGVQKKILNSARISDCFKYLFIPLFSSKSQKKLYYFQALNGTISDRKSVV